MMAVLLWFGVALGSPPDLAPFPQRIEARCPEQGLCRIEVPGPFVADNAAAWLVVNAAGEPVPWAVLSEDASPAMPRRTSVKMSGDDNAVLLSVPDDCAVEAVEVEFGWGSFQAAARAEVRFAGQPGFVSGPWEMVGAGLIDEDRTQLSVPEGPVAALKLVFDRPWSSLPPTMETRLLCRDASWVPPAVVEMEAGPTGPMILGQSRYTFSLPERSRIVGLELHPEGDVFRRQVSVATWVAEDGDLRPATQFTGMIQRVKVGDLAVDRTRLEGLALSTDRVALDVADGADVALSIPRVSATLARRVLLVRDAGTVVLYGGDPELRLSYDLQLAAAELARAPFQEATLSAVETNPAFNDPLAADALKPGAVLEPERFLRSRAVRGQGISRIQLPLDVLARTRPDLSDLRILDAEGRQIPFVVDWGGVDEPIEGVTVEHEQQGQISRIRIRSPLDMTPVSTLRLHSPDQDFTREVSLFSSSSGGRTLMAYTDWSVPPAGLASLMMQVNARVGGAMLVEIDHGDNRVIEVDSVTLLGPTAALVARLPEGGATLFYGDRSSLERHRDRPLGRLRDHELGEALARPSYDADRLAQTLTRAPAALATLGPELNLAPATPSATDRGFASAGIGILVLGLLGLVGWLLKGVVSPDEGGPDAGGPASGGPTG